MAIRDCYSWAIWAFMMPERKMTRDVSKVTASPRQTRVVTINILSSRGKTSILLCVQCIAELLQQSKSISFTIKKNIFY